MKDDRARYLGFDGERLRWVEEAIASTKKWIGEATGSASTELMMSTPGDFDYDVAIDDKRAIKAAEKTLKALEAEQKGIEASQAMLKSDLDSGKYKDD